MGVPVGKEAEEEEVAAARPENFSGRFSHCAGDLDLFAF